ncbi:MAG: hypothetical protein GF401_00445 [Chitinivibrionales bacterium]|nr:hypothetical protein [Chitinivibrionales bacterium]
MNTTIKGVIVKLLLLSVILLLSSTQCVYRTIYCRDDGIFAQKIAEGCYTISVGMNAQKIKYKKRNFPNGFECNTIKNGIKFKMLVDSSYIRVSETASGYQNLEEYKISIIDSTIAKIDSVILHRTQGVGKLFLSPINDGKTQIEFISKNLNANHKLYLKVENNKIFIVEP